MMITAAVRTSNSVSLIYFPSKSFKRRGLLGGAAALAGFFKNRS